MGTNYYWRDMSCGRCGRFEEIHVGKSSAGWSFAFRAYPHRLIDGAHPEWGYDQQSPFGFPVVSRADWRTVFGTRRGTLWDEYGRQVPDPLGWLAALPVPAGDQIAWERRRVGLSWHTPAADEEWRDPEGFRFNVREFF